MASLTDRTLSGFIWAFGERFGVQVMQMVIFIVLARILTPEVFGLMGMLAVFIAVSQSLTDSGFGQALIQKKKTDEIDYASVFYINLIVSVIMYGLLYLSAPLIASFYGEPILINLIRVLGLKFIVAAFSMVQIARLTKEVKFKKLMIAKLPSTLLGGTAGIGAAYMDFGVWSLVIQQITDTTAYSIQVWIQSKWRPKWVFDWQRVKKLFDFGSKIMVDSFISTIYKNIYEIIIGRYFSTIQVGYYTQANKIKQLPVLNISSALGRVTFPILSGIQDDNKRLKRAYKNILKLVFFVVSPVMVGAIVLAEPLFRLVLTEKWMPAVPYFQWLCITGMLYPIQYYNQNIIKVKGRSDLLLYIGLLKKAIAITGIFIFIQFSVLALVIFRAFNSVVAYFINSYFSGIFINYKVTEQLRDIWIYVVFSGLTGIVVWRVLKLLELGDSLTIIIGVFIGSVVYLLIIYFADPAIYNYSISVIKNYRNTQKKND